MGWGMYSLAGRRWERYLPLIIPGSRHAIPTALLHCTVLYCTDMAWHGMVYGIAQYKKALGKADQGQHKARYPVSDRLLTTIHAD